MKIALIGATGFVGTQLLKEFSQRGHHVTAIARNIKDISTGNQVQAVQLDISDQEALSAVLKGHDAVVSAYNGGWTNPNLYEDFLRGSKSIQEAVKDSGIKRFVVVGGAGSLYIAEGVRLLDSPEFPAEYQEGARGAADYLDYLKAEQDLDWSFFSPAIEMHPGTAGIRTGKYRLGLDNPVFDENNRSVLSVEDVAVVIADELDTNAHIKQRFTAAY